MKEQKGALKQYCLKQAVQDQKEKKWKQDFSDLNEEIKVLENSLQRERGLNIQSNQQIAVRPGHASSTIIGNDSLQYRIF